MIILLIVLAMAAGGVPVLAHPTATTEVILTFGSDRACNVTILTDAGPLATKLKALGEAPLSSYFDLRFDGRTTPLSFVEMKPVADQPGRMALRFSARTPVDATHLTWKTTLVYGSYPLAVRRGETTQIVEWINGAAVSRAIAVDAVQAPGVTSLLALGFTHILPKGLDHILFVLGLFLLARRTREVLIQVTAFTVAHSVTLGLAIVGLVSLPSAIVEPLIALSIVYVAVENLFVTSLTPWRVALVFAFGLLHGLGFAEALRSLDVAPGALVQSLLAFNAGVEAGQLTVILLAASAIALLRIPPARYRTVVARPASLAIAITGVVWAIQRLTT